MFSGQPRKFILELIAQDNRALYISSWDGDGGELCNDPKLAYRFHYAMSAKRAGNKVALQLGLTSIPKVYELVKDSKNKTGYRLDYVMV